MSRIKLFMEIKKKKSVTYPINYTYHEKNPCSKHVLLNHAIKRFFFYPQILAVNTNFFKLSFLFIFLTKPTLYYIHELKVYINK